MVNINDLEKTTLINRLIPELPVLRTKAGLSQDELSGLLGISRQTYSSIETQKRKMSWSIYLSLVFIFDNNVLTHSIVRDSGFFPEKLFGVSRRKDTSNEVGISSFIKIENEDIKNHLDERAIHAIETVVMVEYARCNNISGEAVIKAFDGKQLTKPSEYEYSVRKSIENLKIREEKLDE